MQRLVSKSVNPHAYVLLFSRNFNTLHEDACLDSIANVSPCLSSQLVVTPLPLFMMDFRVIGPLNDSMVWFDSMNE